MELDLEQIDVPSLLPHGSGIIAVKKVLQLKEKSARCLVVANNPATIQTSESGEVSKVSAVSCIEYIAQAAAVGKVCSHFSSNNVQTNLKSGAIIKVKNCSLKVPHLDLGQNLTVEVSWTDSIAGAFQVMGQVADGEKVVAQAEMTLLEKPQQQKAVS